jgi:hypothetical protein
MASTRLSPSPLELIDHVGDTHSILLTVTGEDLTLWTVTGTVFACRAGAALVDYTVSAGATRTMTLSSAQTAALGIGKHWYEIRTVDPGGNVQTVAHGELILEG